MPEVHASVRLIQYTPAPEELVAMAGRLCYSPADLAALEQRVSEKDQSRYLDMLMQLGHASTMEHASFTFGIEGVSRSLMAQITRHRIASFSVQSQRYVTLGDEGAGFDYVMPPQIAALGEEAVREYARQMGEMDAWYRAWREKLGGAAGNEDARFVLPNAAATRMLVTMNARELAHFIRLRCCNRAQWEIRDVAWRMFELACERAPLLFRYAGPACAWSACSEGKMNCGRAQQVRARARALTRDE